MGRGRPSISAAPRRSGKSDGSSRATSTQLPQRKSPSLVQSKLPTVVLGKNNVGGKRAAAKRVSKLSSTSSVEEVPAEKTKRMKGRQTKEEMLQELIAFDLDSAFGPAKGISRLERLERAAEFGLCSEESKLQQLRANLECLLAEGVGEAELCLWDHPTLYATYDRS